MEENKNKERTKSRRRKKEQKRRRRKRREKEGRNFFEISGKGGPMKRKEKNPPQCLVWFRLNGLGSSQNGQNSLIHNWCIGGCWFTLAHEIKVWIMFLLVTGTGTGDSLSITGWF
jgi:hypothetical protein